jgi:hypothetical protein
MKHIRNNDSKWIGDLIMTKIRRCVNKRIFPVLILALTVALGSSLVSDASQNETGEHERNRYLLLDSRIIENTENAKLTIGKVQKHKDNPLFEEDKPWEKRFDNLYANVIYDEQENIYKCWLYR